MNMNAVGIDVSKGKSMVAILRPFGEIVSTPFEVKHTVSGIRSLIEHIKAIDGESRIVMAVSYTHLDVYKRQILSGCNLLCITHPPMNKLIVAMYILLVKRVFLKVFPAAVLLLPPW